MPAGWVRMTAPTRAASTRSSTAAGSGWGGCVMGGTFVVRRRAGRDSNGWTAGRASVEVEGELVPASALAGLTLRVPGEGAVGLVQGGADRAQGRAATDRTPRAEVRRRAREVVGRAVGAVGIGGARHGWGEGRGEGGSVGGGGAAEVHEG